MNYTSQGTMIYYHCDGNVTYTKVKLKRRILVTCGAEVNYFGAFNFEKENDGKATINI